VPSLLHEEILDLLRGDPSALFEALVHSGKLPLPAFTHAELRAGEIRLLVPTEWRLDLLFLLRGVQGDFALPVEIQQSIDRKKARLWPFAVASVALTHACPTALVVVTTKPNVARWARGPFPTGHPGYALQPIVVGPDDFPWVTDPEEAKRAPHRAILSALMHRDDPRVVPVVHAAFASLEALPPTDADQWRELLADALQSNELAKQVVETIMSIENFREKSTWFREGREEGREVGWQQGQEAGREKGAIDSTRAAVLRVLTRRSLPLTPAHRERLDDCTDLSTLERWLDLAVVATSADEALRLAARHLITACSPSAGRPCPGRRRVSARPPGQAPRPPTSPSGASLGPEPSAFPAPCFNGGQLLRRRSPRAPAPASLRRSVLGSPPTGNWRQPLRGFARPRTERISCPLFHLGAAPSPAVATHDRADRIRWRGGSFWRTRYNPMSWPSKWWRRS
jgi:hypothetical protein